jgi:L-proline amide hydrolase
LSQSIEGYAPFGDYRTWYRVTGDMAGGKPPLVALHGGPGCTHDYIEAYADLAAGGRAVVHYDQLGNGKSTHLRDADPGFWTVSLFLAELDNLLAHLGVAGCYDMIGQSWGGMLAAEHAVLRPPGLRRLVIANSPASMRTWVAEANRLRADLPGDVQEALSRHEADGTTDHPDYVAATRAFYDRHLCRVAWSDGLERTFAAMMDDPTVYGTMNGPSEFHVIGTIRDWTIEDRLNAIDVPVLLISGYHDEATPLTQKPFLDHIPDVRQVVFPHSSHLPHIEERAAFMPVVEAFLDAA